MFANSLSNRRCYYEGEGMLTGFTHWGTSTLVLAMSLVAGAAKARADGGDDSGVSPEHAPRRADATWREIVAGPFPSSRLFAMPTANVVGAFQISLSGDASLLNEPNVLSSSGVAAIGFGDIAQLEYRGSSAISTLDEDAIRLPTLGFQLKAPYRQVSYLPEIAAALRLGLPRTETSADGAVVHSEAATDLYFVASLRLGERASLHGGLRVASAEIDSEGAAGPEDIARVLYLPAVGVEVVVVPTTRLVAEVALVPLFDPGDETRASEIRSGVFGRAGIRWQLVPSVVFDASVGYRIEVDRLTSDNASMADALVDWDIRLGGEIFVPWGAVLCRGVGLFCE